MGIELDPETHTYRNDGQVVPGVTSIIKAALGDPFAGIPSATLERKRRIGNAAHRACELDFYGTLDESTIADAVWPYFLAWRAFVSESGFIIGESEKPLYCRLGFAGQPDFYGQMADGRAAVIDLKTGLPGPMAALQTAAYQELEADNHGERVALRYALQALPSGRYKLIPYTDPGDWPDFLACLRVHRLKERLSHG